MKRKKNLTRKQRRSSRTNRGDAYQHLVAEMARAFHPKARVQAGEWVDGPDGRLDLDVSIRWEAEGSQRLCVVECKDYDVSKAGKVGRPIVDALESKRRDLNAQHSLICSNSGFTADALHKAARVGIGMISVMKKGDGRVKFIAEQDQFIQRIKMRNWRFSYTFREGVIELQEAIEEPRYQGLPVNRWLVHVAQFAAFVNPGCTDTVAFKVQFRAPLLCTVNGMDMTMLDAAVQFSYLAEWRVRRARLDLTSGLYDHFRRAVRMAPGLNQVSIAPRDGDEGILCDPTDVPPLRESGPGEFDASLTEIQNAPQFEAACPDLAPLIVPEDLVLRLGDRDYCRNDRERQQAGMMQGFNFRFLGK